MPSCSSPARELDRSRPSPAPSWTGITVEHHRRRRPRARPLRRRDRRFARFRAAPTGSVAPERHPPHFADSATEAGDQSRVSRAPSLPGARPDAMTLRGEAAATRAASASCSPWAWHPKALPTAVPASAAARRGAARHGDRDRAARWLRARSRGYGARSRKIAQGNRGGACGRTSSTISDEAARRRRRRLRESRGARSSTTAQPRGGGGGARRTSATGGSPPDRVRATRDRRRGRDALPAGAPERRDR